LVYYYLGDIRLTTAQQEEIIDIFKNRRNDESNLKEKNMKIIRWDEYLNDINDLIRIIEKSDFDPELIYTIPRGGLIIATIISHYFNDIPIYFPNMLIPTDRKILIVDDLCDTGCTLRSLSKGNNHRTACLYRKEHSIYYPDFLSIDNLDSNEWIVFPYDRIPKSGDSEIKKHMEKINENY